MTRLPHLLGVCRLADFGLSRVLDMNASHVSTQSFGTVPYMPPELLSQGRMTTKVDVYSFAILSAASLWRASHLSTPNLTLHPECRSHAVASASETAVHRSCWVPMMQQWDCTWKPTSIWLTLFLPCSVGADDSRRALRRHGIQSGAHHPSLLGGTWAVIRMATLHLQRMTLQSAAVAGAYLVPSFWHMSPAHDEA